MKHEFPVFKKRDDGTPGIWLTHDQWLLLEGGIVGAYLDRRGSLGREQARFEKRRELGSVHQNKRLKEWEFLDSWPQSNHQAKTALRLFNVGYEAYGHIGERNDVHRWTPEKVVDFGDRFEKRAYDEEMKLIEAAEQTAPGKEQVAA